MSKKIITLKSSDGVSFKIDEAVAIQSTYIKLMVEDDCVSNEIPLRNVTGTILSKVIEYCKKHAGADTSTDEGKEELKKWDAEFMKKSESSLFDLMMASNYLHIKSLLDLTSHTVADLLSRKTPEEIRACFNIKNDLTAEEEAAIRRENQWAFE